MKGNGRIGGSNESLSAREAAAYLGVSYWTLMHHYKDDWKIPSYRPNGSAQGPLRFLRRHLDSHIERNTG